MKRIAVFLMAWLALGLAQKGELRLFIWSEYIDPAILQAFTQKYGYRVRMDLYESNEEMIAKLQAGGCEPVRHHRSLGFLRSLHHPVGAGSTPQPRQDSQPEEPGR